MSFTRYSRREPGDSGGIDGGGDGGGGGGGAGGGDGGGGDGAAKITASTTGCATEPTGMLLPRRAVTEWAVCEPS